MHAMDEVTRKLFAILDDYKDPIGYLHPKLRPQYAAAAVKQLRGMKKLLKAGAQWRARPDGRDAPFIAAFFDDPRPLELMIDHGVPVDHTDPSRGNQTLMHRAAAFGRKHMIQMLATRGASLTTVDAAGKTPIEVARAWKHGAAGLPLLTRLTKAALKAKPREVEGDLGRAPMLALLATQPKLFSKDALRDTAKFVKATFATAPTARWETFLTELGAQSDDSLVAVGVWLSARVSTEKSTVRTEKGGPLRIVHLGDLVVSGDCDATTLVVTGSLTVKGRLTNWEGRGIYVGGSLKADVVVTEGPLWVQEDAVVKRGMMTIHNDYRTTIVGKLSTPVLVQDDHGVDLGRKSVLKHYRSRDVVPASEVGPLTRMFGLRKW